MTARVGRRLLSVGVLTLGTGAATGLAAAAGAGPFASLPGHGATAHLAAAVQPTRKPLDVTALFPAPTAAAAQEQTVYVDDPAPAPLVIFAPAPASTVTTTTTGKSPSSTGGSRPGVAPTGSASAHNPGHVTARPSLSPGPCRGDDCGGGVAPTQRVPSPSPDPSPSSNPGLDPSPSSTPSGGGGGN